MSKYDIRNPIDFRKITNDQSYKDLERLLGLNSSLWDLEEGSYNGVVFHIFKSHTLAYQGGLSKIEDMGGRRKAKYLYPYQDGQTTEDMGRRPETVNMDILIHGRNYRQLLDMLLEQFNDTSKIPGILVHPVRSRLTTGSYFFDNVFPSTPGIGPGLQDNKQVSRMVVEEYRLLHESTTRNAVLLNVTFIEHNFTVGDFNDLTISGGIKNLKAALADALTIFNSIESAIDAVNEVTGLAQSFKALVTSLLTNQKDDAAKVLADINQTFNAPTGATGTLQQNSADIPALLPTDIGGLRNPDGTLASTTAISALSPSDPYAAIPLDVLKQTTLVALASEQAVNNVNVLRLNLSVIIQSLESSLDGQGALVFYSTILSLKETALKVQTALEAGLASSRNKIINYTLPRLMTIREVAFANKVPLDNVIDIEVLNPSLLSVNYIPSGTVLKVPLS